MGGRGQSNPKGGGWKSKLSAYARRGEMPTYITGNRDQQAQVFEEIDKLYSMPDTDARIVDQGDGVWVQLNGKVYQAGYPSKENASEAEKRGVLKKVLYNADQDGMSKAQFDKRMDSVSERRYQAERSLERMYSAHPDLSDGQVQKLPEFKKKAKQFKDLDKEFNRLVKLAARKGW